MYADSTASSGVFAEVIGARGSSAAPSVLSRIAHRNVCNYAMKWTAHRLSCVTTVWQLLGVADPHYLELVNCTVTLLVSGAILHICCGGYIVKLVGSEYIGCRRSNTQRGCC